jgi:hypothetical protein
LALLPEARAGCSNTACPDPWRGLWATMIPTPTAVQNVPIVDQWEQLRTILGGPNDLNGLNETNG